MPSWLKTSVAEHLKPYERSNTKESSAHWHNMLIEMLLAMSSIYISVTWLCELKLQEAFIKCNCCRISNRRQLLLRVASKESFVQYMLMQLFLTHKCWIAVPPFEEDCFSTLTLFCVEFRSDLWTELQVLAPFLTLHLLPPLLRAVRYWEAK